MAEIFQLVAFQLPGDIIGTLPGWITSAGVLALLGLLVRNGIAWRGQSLGAEERIRDHYAREVARQTDNIIRLEEHWRAMLREEEEKHEECRADRDKLRERIAALEDELSGVKRQIAASSADRMVILEGRRPSEVAPNAAASAPRVLKETGGK